MIDSALSTGVGMIISCPTTSIVVSKCVRLYLAKKKSNPVNISAPLIVINSGGILNIDSTRGGSGTHRLYVLGGKFLGFCFTMAGIIPVASGIKKSCRLL